MKRIANLHFRNVQIRIFSTKKINPNLRIHNSETEEPKKPRSIRIKQLGERYRKHINKKSHFKIRPKFLFQQKNNNRSKLSNKIISHKNRSNNPLHQATTPFNQETKNTKNSTPNKRSPFPNPKFTTNPEKKNTMKPQNQEEKKKNMEIH